MLDEIDAEPTLPKKNGSEPILMVDLTSNHVASASTSKTRIRGVANLRHPQPNSPGFVYVLFLVVSVQVAHLRHT
jgi:hypothetical protein